MDQSTGLMWCKHRNGKWFCFTPSSAKKETKKDKTPTRKVKVKSD